MRVYPLFALCTVALVAGACDKDGIITQTPPPLGGLRYINAVPDARSLNFLIVDVPAYAPNTVGATFRTGGSPMGVATAFLPPHLAVAAGTRHIRIFWNHTNPDSAQIVVAESNNTFSANSNYTYVLDGTFAAPTVTIINDDVAAPPAGQVGVRLIHLGDGLGPVEVYRRKVGQALPGTLVTGLDNVAEGAVSAVVSVDTTAAAGDTLRFAVFPQGSGGAGTPIVDVKAPPGSRGTTSLNPIPGTSVLGTSVSFILFPRPVAASLAQTGPADTLPTAAFMTDRRPANTVP
jgi:uncharacterized protein DUF4397